MKRILSTVLAVIMALGMAPTLSAAVPEPITVGYSMTTTVKDRGAPTSGVPATINKGSEFDVLFLKDSFNWSAAGNGTYVFPNPFPAWAKVVTGAATNPFVVTAIFPDILTGNVIVRIKANDTFSGNVSVYLDSSGTGLTATKALVKNITVNVVDSSISKTKAGGTAPDSTSHPGNTATLKAGDKMYFRFRSDNFEWSAVGGNTLAQSLGDKSWIKLSGATIGTDFSVSYETAAGNSGEVLVVLTALRSGTFNDLRVYLQGGGGSATTASPSMKVTVESIVSGKITGIASGAQLGGTYSGAYFNGRAISYSQLGNLEVEPGDELLMPLDAGFFTWDGATPYASTAVTNSQLRSGKISVAVSTRQGRMVFRDDKPEIITEGGRAYVRVRFVEYLNSTKDVDFSMLISMTIDGRRHNDSSLDLAGTMIQDVFELDSDYAYYDLSYGGMVEATKYIRGAELYLGSGVTIHANLSKGRKYAGRATNDTNREDEERMAKYPSIEEVITLITTNLSNSGNLISFEQNYGNYYIYDKNLKYLGRSSEKLVYSDKYYLSSEKINVYDDDSDDRYDNWEVEEEGSDSSFPETDDTTFPHNENINPGTGR